MLSVRTEVDNRISKSAAGSRRLPMGSGSKVEIAPAMASGNPG